MAVADPARQLEEIYHLAHVLGGDSDDIVTGLDYETCNTTTVTIALPVQLACVCVAPLQREHELLALGLQRFAVSGSTEHQTRGLYGLSVFINPGQHIDESSSEIHGIRDEHVANGATVWQSCKWLASVLEVTGWVVGYNGKGFDLPLAASLGQRVGVPELGLQVDRLIVGQRVVDPMAILRRAQPNNLEALHVRLGLGALSGGASHSAMPDTIAAMAIAGNMHSTQRWWTSKDDVDEFDAVFVDGSRKLKMTKRGQALMAERGCCPASEVRLDFGGHKGRTLAEMSFMPDERSGQPGGYLRWVISKDFSATVKAACSAALNQRNITR